jgi:hypothetical protein
MRVLLIVSFAGLMFGQNSKLPPDIDPHSNSRLPLIQRDQLNDDEKKVFDDVANTPAGARAAVQSTNRRVHSDAQFSPAVYRARLTDVRNLGVDRGARI